MSDEGKPEASLLDDAKDVKHGVDEVAAAAKDAAKAVDKFFSDGTSKVIGPAATKALVDGKKLVNRVVEKLFKREPES